MFESFLGTWLPLTLIFLATWGTGTIMAMGPLAQPAQVDKAATPDDPHEGPGITASV